VVLAPQRGSFLNLLKNRLLIFMSTLAVFRIRRAAYHQLVLRHLIDTVINLHFLHGLLHFLIVKELVSQTLYIHRV